MCFSILLLDGCLKGISFVILNMRLFLNLNLNPLSLTRFHLRARVILYLDALVVSKRLTGFYILSFLLLLLLKKSSHLFFYIHTSSLYISFVIVECEYCSRSIKVAIIRITRREHHTQKKKNR